MKALTYHGPRDVRFETAPDPTRLGPRDAIVHVELAGLCGSDLHVYRGTEVGLDVGTVMGHEFVGRVVEVGDAVSGLARGTRVASPFSTCCGHCYYCVRGLSARCVEGHLYGWVQNGAGLHGAQAERVRVPLADTTLVPVPDDLPDDVALLLGDVLATGYYCALQAGFLPTLTPVVIGCGPVGLAAVLAARELGAQRVLAVDTVPERLAYALRLGAETIDATHVSGRDQVIAATEGRGADVALEAVGTSASMRLAFDVVRPGGVISAVGVHHAPVFPFSPLEAYDRNVSLSIGRCPARSLMTALVPLARRRAADLSGLFTHRLPLSRGPEAYALFDERREGCIKVALTPH
jgi:threonine dehydrogenase-like Zn-dependent dehydrogenase